MIQKTQIIEILALKYKLSKKKTYITTVSAKLKKKCQIIEKCDTIKIIEKKIPAYLHQLKKNSRHRKICLKKLQLSKNLLNCKTSRIVIEKLAIEKFKLPKLSKKTVLTKLLEISSNRTICYKKIQVIEKFAMENRSNWKKS